MEKKILYAGQDWKRPWGNLRYPHGTPEEPNPLHFTALNNTILQDVRRGEIYDYEVRIKPGTYYIGDTTLTPIHDARVTYKADGGEVILSGGRRIEGFQETTVNGVRALYADIPLVQMGDWYFEELYVNKKPRTRPVFPRNGEKLRIVDIPAHTSDNSSHVGYCRVEKGIFENYTNIEDISLEVLHYWIFEPFPIRSYDPETGLLRFSVVSCWTLDDDCAGGYAKYRIRNVFEELKEPGEWYLNRKTGRLYYIPMEGETADNILVEAPVTPNLLSLTGTAEHPISNIRFEGITFENMKSDPCNWKDEIRLSSYAQAAGNRKGGIRLTYAKHTAFDRCTFRNIGNYGLDLSDGCSYNTVTNCEFSGCGAGGLRIHGGDVAKPEKAMCSHNRVENCHIHHCTLVDYGAVGLWIGHGSSNRVAHNEIHDLKYSGISVGWVWGMLPSRSDNNIIEYNHIYNCGDGDMSDLGGIYLLGPQGGTEVRGNYIHDVHRANYGGWGIYLDEGSTNVVVEKNIVYDCDSEAFFIHYGRENIIRYNIFGAGDAVVGFGAGIEANFGNFMKNLYFFGEEPVYFGDNNYDFAQKWLTTDCNFFFHTADTPLWNLRGNKQKEAFSVLQNTGNDTFSKFYRVENKRPMKTPAELIPFGFPPDVSADKAGIHAE